MSWRDLFKPQDKDPKNIVEWLGLITDDIKKLKNTDNWYDEVNLLTDRSIIDNLDTNVGDFALSARQGYLLNQKIGVSDQNITVLKEEVSQLQLDIIEANKKITEIKDTDIRLINETISTINESLTSHGQTLEAHGISIEQNKTDIEGLGTRVTKNESDISLLDGRVTENELEITSLGERVTKNESDIVNINSNIDIIEEDITDIRNEISQNIEISNTRIDSLVGTNVKISGLDVSINSTNTQLTISPGKAIIEGKIVEVKEAVVKDIDPLLLSEDNLLYTLISLEEETNNIVVSLSESDMDSKSLRIHTMIINNGSIIESTNNSNMVPISSIVGISADNEAANIREQIPSGFTLLGDLDYDYMRNNENQVKFKSKSVAYVNGYKIEIPAETIVNIDKAPEKDSRDDLLFLEAWKDIDFPKTGQLKWRIRYNSNIDFESNYDGLSWSSWYYTSLTFAQGGNMKPTFESNDRHRVGNEHAHFKNSAALHEIDSTIINFMKTKFNDPGLFVAGDGTDYYRNLLKTLDGYCYAIPMFRLYRKPSCGKLEPYEFDKINKLCDYEKVKSLVTSEKVERVINETIYGNTLTNYCTPMKSIGTSGIASITTEIGENSFKITTTSAGSSVLLTQVLSTLATNTTYTIILDVEQMTSEYIQIGDRINSGLFGNNYVPSTNLGFGRNKIKFTTGTDLTDYGIWIGRTDSLASGSIIHIKNLMILEGDCTGFNYVPEYFSGLSSLGESEYNLIKVKNGIIDKTTYNPISGNQKLKALPDVSHIKSENLIIPEIVAEVKRGEDKLSDLTEFSKLETTGDETIEFTNIKGRTLQNLINNGTNITSYTNTRCTIIKFNSGIKATNTETITSSTSYYFNKNNCSIKPNTVYTVIYNLDYNITPPSPVFYGSSRILELTNNKGYNICKITTPVSITNENPRFIFYINIDTLSNWVSVTELMLLEGDWTETPIEKIPYVDGIKSVGESENNIILLSNYNDYLVDNNWYPVMSSSGAAVTVKPNILEDYSTNKYASIFAELEPGDYVISSSDYLYLNRESRNGKIKQLASISLPYKFTVDYKQLVGFSIERSANATDPTDIYIENNLPKDFKIKIEKGTTPTEYNEDKQKIYLKEPLRSLPNGVYDEIIGNKITRRVGKLILNGSENLNLLATTTGWTTDSEVLAVDYRNIPNLKKGSTIIHDSDLVSLTNVSGRMGNTHYIATWRDGNNIVIGILRSKLSSQDLSGCKTWLSQNPITLYYEMTNPIVEYLEYGYDKESIKTYQLDAPLRSLPNGVKDEIKDGYLFRRCGEIILDGTNGSISEWGRADTNTFSFLIKLSNDINNKLGSWMDGIQKISKSDKFICYNGRELQVNDKEGISIWNVKNNINIKILKSRLSSESITGVKEWLQNNPIKIIYELLTPQIIKLNETHITNPEYSLNRQFKKGNWLRTLGNGVKDSNESGKVIRRIGKILLNGNETWAPVNSTSTTRAFIMDLPLSKKGASVISDKFNFSTSAASGFDGIGILSNRKLWIEISNSKLSTLDVDGFKTWLANNIVTAYYELETSTEEAIDDTNYTYYPSHDKFNTTCSSLYVTDGYNKIDVLNNVKSSDNIIETSYRVIENTSEIEDAHYKPSVNGKELSYVIPKGKNKINMFDYTLNESSNKCIVYRNENKLVVSTVESSKWAFPIRWYIRLKPNSSYTISANVESEYLTNYLIRVYSYSEDTIISASNSTTNLLKTINSITTTTSFKTDDNGGILVAFLIARDTNTNTYAPNIPFSISNLQIEEGTAKTDYEEFIPDVRAFENIDSNDVKDMRNLVSLTGYNYEQILNKSFDLLLKGEI